MDNEFVKIVLEGAKRKVGKSASRQMQPITTEMAKEVVQRFGDDDDLKKHRLIVICLLGFSGFLRISELVAIQIKHLTFFDSRVEINIPKAKNDQLREGHLVHIGRTGTPFCPVNWLQRYLNRTGFSIRKR